MKRAIVASVLGIAFSITPVATLHGQGVIAFDNYSGQTYAHAGRVRWGYCHPAGYSTGDFVNVGVVSLYAGQGVLTDSTALMLIATTPIFTTSGYGGGWYDMAASLVGLGYAQIPASIWSGTQTVTFQVRLGVGYGFIGTIGSALWQETPDTAGGSIDPSSPNEMLNGPLPLVVWCPEPNAMALAGLGAGMLLFRRKR